MTDRPRPRPVRQPALVAITHSSPWQPDRHAPAFLRPVVAGILRRLAVKLQLQ